MRRRLGESNRRLADRCVRNQASTGSERFGRASAEGCQPEMGTAYFLLFYHARTSHKAAGAFGSQEIAEISCRGTRLLGLDWTTLSNTGTTAWHSKAWLAAL